MDKAEHIDVILYEVRNFPGRSYMLYSGYNSSFNMSKNTNLKYPCIRNRNTKETEYYPFESNEINILTLLPKININVDDDIRLVPDPFLGLNGFIIYPETIILKNNKINVLSQSILPDINIMKGVKMGYIIKI